MALGSSYVLAILHNLIIIIMRNYSPVLNRYDERSGSQLMSVGYILSSVCLYMVNFPNDFLCNMWDCMYATGPFRLRCSRCYIIRTASYVNQFSSIILFHCCCILSGLCVWGGCTVIFCQLLYIYPEKLGFCFSCHGTVYDVHKWYDTLKLIDRIRVLTHYTYSLSSVYRVA